MNSISSVSIRTIPETQAGLHSLKTIALFAVLFWARVSAWQLAWI
jgi:hypothetical protein